MIRDALVGVTGERWVDPPSAWTDPAVLDLVPLLSRVRSAIMPYYSIRLHGGTRSEHLDVKHALNGRDADHTGVTSFFYVERSYDIRSMRADAQSMAGRGIDVVVEEITEGEFRWREV